MCEYLKLIWQSNPVLFSHSSTGSDDARCTVMEDHSPSTSPDDQTSVPPKLSNFKRVSRTEDSSPYPIPGLAADILHMRVKEGSKIRNLLRFATARIQGGGDGGEGVVGPSLRQVVFTGSGRGVTKTITCVEIFKRKVGGLHQVSKLYYKTVNEIWESPQQGAPRVPVQTKVPAICILLSKDPLDAREPGYQPPQTHNAPADNTERREAQRRPDSSSSQDSTKRIRLDDSGAFGIKTQSVIKMYK